MTKREIVLDAAIAAYSKNPNARCADVASEFRTLTGGDASRKSLVHYYVPSLGDLRLMAFERYVLQYANTHRHNPAFELAMLTHAAKDEKLLEALDRFYSGPCGGNYILAVAGVLEQWSRVFA